MKIFTLFTCIATTCFSMTAHAQSFQSKTSATKISLPKSVLSQTQQPVQNQQAVKKQSAYSSHTPVSKNTPANSNKTSSWCLSDEVTNDYILKQTQYDPDYINKSNKIHNTIQKWINNNSKNPQQQAIKTIPVVVHVVYNTPDENVSDALIFDMIQIINEDFRRLNADTSQTRAIFKPVAADAQIEFCLAQRDPSNNPTNGITRTSTSKTYWNPTTETDDMKKTFTGGEDAWNPFNYLNIWIADIDNGVGFGTAGYAYLPTPGMHGSWRDGLVLDNNIGICFSCRVATHEIGHYLGLKHTWGNNPPSCSDDDGFTDTPTSASENFGCNTSQNTCVDTPTDLPDQIENYMSYADCQNMYSTGQANYMNSVLNTTRGSLLNSQACQPTAPPVANFTANNTTITAGQYVQFSDLTTGGATSWAWNFGGGGTPNTSTMQNPTILFSTIGTYTITLTATNSLGSDTEIKNSYINVIANTSNCDTVNWAFLNANPLYYYTCGAGCGFIAGTNQFDDKAKAQLFTTPEYAPNTHITGGLFYFSHAYKSATSNGKVVFSIWDDNGTGGSPNTVLGTDTFDLADIVSDVQGNFLTQPLFIPPVAVSGSYYFGFQMLNFDLWGGGTRDSLALTQTQDGTSASSSLPWEQWSNNTWASFATSWSFTNSTLFATPYMTDMPPTASFTADTLEGCGTLIVKFDASASVNGTQYYWDVDGDDTLDYLTYTPDITIQYLGPGTYDVSLWVMGVCTGLDSIKKNNYITIYDVPVLTTTSTNSSCLVCDGSATVSVSGGTSPFSYLWNDPSPAQTTTTATGLCSGAYQVLVTDANGCNANSGVSVLNGSGLALSVSATDATCGLNNGMATVTTTGGAPPYSYLWSNGNTTSAINNLSSGTYNLTITDANGCTVATDFYSAAVISDIPYINDAAATGTNLTCYNGNNGSATASATTGVTPYSFLWSNSSTTATITGIAAGTYTVTITDFYGCTDTASVTITQPAAITSTVSVNNILCNGQNTGSAAVIAGGGSPGYLYSWSTTPAQTTSNATGLSAATYTVTITDASGCTKTDTVTVSQPTPIVVTLTANPANCGLSNGSADASSSSGGTGAHTYLWSNGQTASVATGLAAGSYTVTITDANGCTMASVANVTNIGAPVVSVLSQANVSCNGGNDGSATSSVSGGIAPYTYSWNTAPIQTTVTATGLSAGSYNITVTDSVGCIGIITATITEPPVLTASISQNNISCNGGNNGSATANAGGGTPPYTYVWNSTPVQNTVTATGLAAGSYTVTITDANGCTQTASASITQPAAALTASVVTVTPICGNNNGSVSVTPSGGTGTYTYSWNNGNTTSVVSGLTGQPTDTLVFSVTDANGCTFTDTVFVNCVLAVNENNIEPGFNVYPNPNFGEFNITLSSPLSSNYTIELFNAIGQVIYSEELKGFGGKFTKRFDVSSFGMGLYVAILRSENKQLFRKVIVY